MARVRGAPRVAAGFELNSPESTVIGLNSESDQCSLVQWSSVVGRRDLYELSRPGLRALNRMRDDGIVREYAIGGATAVLFYAEPSRTYDVDVFVVQERTDADALLSLAPAYDWARAFGFRVESEHIFIHGVPVQLRPAFNALVFEAIEQASVHDYEGTPVRVVSAEHLIALALPAGGARRRERAWLLLQGGVVDRDRVRDILSRHGIQAIIPDDV